MSLADVALVAALGCGLAGVVQLLCFGGSGLLQREEAHLALQELLELVPIGLLAIQLEGVLTLFGQSGVVAPQVPVTAGHCASLLFLAAAHAALDLQTVVDAGSRGDDE